MRQIYEVLYPVASAVTPTLSFWICRCLTVSLFDQQNIIAMTVHLSAPHFRAVEFCTADVLPVVTGDFIPPSGTNGSSISVARSANRTSIDALKRKGLKNNEQLQSPLSPLG